MEEGIAIDNLGTELRSEKTTQIIREKKNSWQKRLLLGFIGLLSLSVLGCLGISGIVGFYLTHPIREPVVGNPSEFGLKYQDVKFSSREDNVKLSGWYIPAENSKAIVIQAHGYEGSRTKEKPSFPLTQALIKKGISVLMFDFRASGESEGSLVSVGDFEQRDLLGAFDYVKSLGYQNIGIIGYSMGASTTAVVAENEAEIKSVVLDSPFADLKEYLQVNMPTWTKLPNIPFTPLILYEIKVITGLKPEEVSPLHEMEKFKERPILFIAGDADDTIPMENSKKLWEKVNNPNRVYGPFHYWIDGFKISTQCLVDGGKLVTIRWVLIPLLVVLLNVPFGYWRANVKKFSFQWFLSVHLPVPCVIILRIYGKLGWHWTTYPLLVGSYLFGQFIGTKTFMILCKKAQVTSCLFVDLFNNWLT